MGRFRKRKKSNNSPENKDNVNKRFAMATNNQQQTGQIQQNNGQFFSNNGYNNPQASQNIVYSQMTPTQNQNQQFYSTPIPMGSPVGAMPSPNMVGPMPSPNMQQYTLPAVAPMQNTASGDQLSVIIQRLENIDQKLTQLDTIKTSVNKITDRLDKLDQKTTKLERTMLDIEKSREYDTTLLDQMREKQKEIDQMMKTVKTLEKEQSTREREMKEEIIDLKSRSMRDNLIFFGIPEEKDEKDTNCMEKVLELIETKLEIENAKNDIKLHRAHRMGKYNPNKTRPIVAKFAFYPDRERVRQNSKKLQKPYGISQQFPKEIMDRRRQLVPIMLDSRRGGKEAYLVADKVYIGDHLYQGPVGASN